MNIEEACELLSMGEVVAFPTETVYGLGADARDHDAVQKIFTIKGRPSDNPLIVHLADIDQVKDFAAEISEAARKLMDACWPGPLTLVVKKKPDVLDIVTAGLPTVALRIPDHPVAQQLIRKAGPLVAPSANRSGRPSPTKAEHVRRDFGSGFPILDGGDSRIGLESTVLKVSEVPFLLLRPGSYTIRELEKISGMEILPEPPASGPPQSPGLKYTHYRPSAEVCWFDPFAPPDPDKALLVTHINRPSGYPNHVHFNSDYDEMAHCLYDLFRTADYRKLSIIAIENLPESNSHPMIAALKNRIDKAVGN